MTIAVHEHGYDVGSDGAREFSVARLRRVFIAAAGCAIMAVSGLGLGIYLNTSTATAAESAPAASAPN